MNHSSAFVVEGDQVVHYEELPEDYAVERFPDCFTLGLRWGRRDHPDLFAIKREPVPEQAHESAFIHPVVRVWRNRQLVAERHLLEDLDPLCAFLLAELKH